MTIDAHNVDKMLVKEKEQLRDELHATPMELYIMHLKSDGRSVNTRYSLLYRVFRHLGWLEERGRELTARLC